MISRTPEQVARRALILGALSFRASLEVTDHPRTAELSGRLLPWLIEVGCEGELGPLEREALETPLGQLDDGQRIDVNWAAEPAAFFCWALGLAPRLDASSPADPSELPDLLAVLTPQAAEIIRSAKLRDGAEIADECRHFVLIRSLLQEARIDPPVRGTIRRINLKRIKDAGLGVTDSSVARATDVVAMMSLEEQERAAGLYFVRDHAALWLCGGRRSYFDSGDEGPDEG